jgi:hypothetical protein
MEAAAYVAGEPHSDHPQCASTVITAFVIEWNDRLGNDRNRLSKPLIPRVGHGGRAYAESAGSGLGSTFTIQLPMTPSQ